MNSLQKEYEIAIKEGTGWDYEDWIQRKIAKLEASLLKQEQSFNARDANRAKANVNLAKLLEVEQKKNKKLTNNLEAMKTSLGAYTATMKRIKELEAEKEDNRERVNQLNDIVGNDEILITKLKASNTEKDSIICNLQSDIRKLEDGQDELNETNNHLMTDLSEAKERIKELEAKIEKLMKKYRKRGKDLAYLRQQTIPALQFKISQASQEARQETLQECIKGALLVLDEKNVFTVKGEKLIRCSDIQYKLDRLTAEGKESK